MYRPPSDPRNRIAQKNPTWRNIIVSYLMVIAIPLALWAFSQPVAGAVVIAALVGLFSGARRAYTLARCFEHCQGFAFDLAGKARITVRQIPADDSAESV